MPEPVGHDLELQCADRAEDDVVAHQRPEHLGGALLAELIETLLQRLHAQGIAQHHAPEQLRREARDAGEAQALALGERVSNPDRAVVVEADDVAGNGVIGAGTFACHEGHRVRDLHVLAGAHLVQLHPVSVAPGGRAQKRDAVPVLRVHVGLDLEHETGEAFFVRHDLALERGPGDGRGRVLDEAVEQLLHAEAVQGGAEEHRRQRASEIGGAIEIVAGAAHQLDLLAQRFRVGPEASIELRLVDSLQHLVLSDAGLAGRREETHPIIRQMIDAPKASAAADRPGDRRAADAQHLLDLVGEGERVPALPVELVDEGHDRSVAETADLHQTAGALLDPAGAVDDHEH